MRHFWRNTMARGQESAMKKLRKIAEERAALDSRERELMEAAASEVADLVLEAGGFKLDPQQFAKIVGLVVKLGEAEAIKRLES